MRSKQQLVAKRQSNLTWQSMEPYNILLKQQQQHKQRSSNSHSHLLDDLLRALPAPADVTQHALDQVKVHTTWQGGTPGAAAQAAIPNSSVERSVAEQSKQPKGEADIPVKIWSAPFLYDLDNAITDARP
jgi:hypothetical protein